MADLAFDRAFGVDRDLIVIIPSRGRPETVAELDRAFVETCTNESTLALLAIDGDDPAHDEYMAAILGCHRLVAVHEQPSGTMVSALNGAALSVAREWVAIGFMGDDHLPRTVGWDEQYLAALREMGTGIVFGNDLLQGHRLPTQCAMTSDIVRAVGYMSPPMLKHLYVDNTWLVWGNSLGRLRYLKDVIVEHRHPTAGKAMWDEGYLRVNDGAVAEHDRLAFEAYTRDGGLRADLEKIQAVMVVPA